RAPVDGGRVYKANVRSRGDQVTFWFRDVQAGVYDFRVFVSGFADPIVEIGSVRVDPGDDQPPAPLTGIDLSTRLFRFELHAVTANGEPVRNLASPLVANITRPSGERQFVAFPWRDGTAEIFSATAELELRLLGHGYRPRTQTVFAGESDVVFEATQPAELVLRGLRELVGDRRVRVSTVLVRDVEIPLSLESHDQATGRSRGYSRANLGKASGAWLGDSDVVQVPLMHDGEYEIVVRIYEPGVRNPESRVMSKVPIQLRPDASPRIEVPLNTQRVRAALEQLRRQKPAEGGR
ncbi:MAG: hypothetical protein KDB80_16085, partial [Planctomycetes bacterium]|nr:hypothetical protein [Planctomycetota bacterium]